MARRTKKDDAVIDSGESDTLPADASADADTASGSEQEDTPRDLDIGSDEDVQEQIRDIYQEVEDGFDAQDERVNRSLDFWDLYNSKLGPNQFYTGNSRIFVPITRNAVNARKTRFVNQLFPTSRRHIEVTSGDESPTSPLVAVIEHYIRRAKLRTQIVPSLLRAGDVEGQYSVYVSWMDTTRSVAWRTSSPLVAKDEETGEEIEDPEESVEDIDHENITISHPFCEVIPDADICVIPFTADSIPEALEDGGSVTIIRRWREGKIKKLKRQKVIDETAADRLLGLLKDGKEATRKDTRDAQLNAAGICKDEKGPYALVYETWAKVEYGDWGDEPRLCVMYLCGGEKEDILSCKRNPYWSDRCPLLSAPVEKVAGSFKGKSQLEAVELIQYQANDAINEAMDSAAYALLPIIMTDPEKNPRVGSMILSLAAVWETDPKSTQFAKFPDMWKDGFNIVNACKAEIFETLSVSPARITQQASTKKLTQAEIASEQQVDMLNTADAVTTLEDEILTPLITMFVELDHQFRDKDLTVRAFGELGLKANMMEVPPIQMDTRYSFAWIGVESSRNAQAIQQQIGAVNVLRTIPPEQYQGYKLNLAPVITHLIENVFGPVLAPQIFEDVRSQLSMDPEQENHLMGENGLDMPIHLLDNHDQHLQSHIKALQEAGPDGDPLGNFRTHIMKHQAAKAMAAQAQVSAMMPKQLMGPGGGAPRPGAQPAAQRPAQQPPGAIHRDQIQDPNRMPSDPSQLPVQGVR